MKYKFIFKFMVPSSVIFHLEVTKNLLMNRLFTNNAILLHTLPDYYLDTETANLATAKLVKQII
jgi:hypothetical protein